MKFTCFIESENTNALIYGPTQLGKTNAARIYIETAFQYNMPVIALTTKKTNKNNSCQEYDKIS